MRLGTFNVWGLPEAFSDDVSSRMRVLSERLAQTDLDVLLIQEAWTPEVRRTIRQGARRAGFQVSHGRDASGGLMTLSRLPIRASRFVGFRFRGDPERVDKGEYIGGKGFEALELEGPDGPFLLVNTHVHARYRVEDSPLDSAVRTAQLLQVVAYVRGHAGIAVIGGDFNCREQDPELVVFRGLTGATELGRSSAFGTLSSTNFYKRHRDAPDKRIDFLFVRPGPGVVWQSSDARLLFSEPARIRSRDRSLSDHYGFRAELGWQSGSTAAAAASFVDPEALKIARSLIEVGLAEADRREHAHFELAGGFALAAAAAAGLRRHPSVDRRAFLRGGMEAVAVVALAPALGFGTLARVDSDRKRAIFDDARAFLSQLEADTPRTHLA